MLDIGLDFGSTYTSVSVYKTEKKALEVFNLASDSPYFPSVVSYYDGEFEFGDAAKSRTGKKNARLYKGFKMLLPEQELNKLKEKGYDETNTPVFISSMYIECILRKILKESGEEYIDNLVVGVPEIWNGGIHTLDGRGVIRDICKKFSFVRKVQVVSEPAAASAFFAYNYKIMTKKDYSGKLLLIDYGGGTLDITLTDIMPAADQKKGKGVEIKVLERTGAGENSDGEIGKAGIIYMENVVKQALSEAGYKEGIDFTYDGKFLKAVDELERLLKTKKEDLDDEFDDNESFLLRPERMDRKFTKIEYCDDEITITYKTLIEVYNRIIRPVFDEKLNEIFAFMDKNKICYQDPSSKDFKIALVGGFGNFYLVEHQMKEKFKFNDFDQRRENIIKDKKDCEKAISFGTALLSSKIIGIRNTAPYSIGLGIASDAESGEDAINYAIRYRQEIEFNKVYYPKDIDGEEFPVFSALGGFKELIINMGSSDKTALVAPVREKFRDRLSGIINNQYGTAVIGFSMDSSETLSIHVHDYDLLENKKGPEKSVIELSSFKELFEDLAKVKKVKKNEI